MLCVVDLNSADLEKKEMVKGHQEIHRQCLEEHFLLNAWMAAGEVWGYRCTGMI